MALQQYSTDVMALRGIESVSALNTFVFQITESVRRIRYVSQIASRPISPLRSDPSSDLFDPVRAAILQNRANDFDEACWLIFLFTHFGKNLRSGYRLLRDVYGRLGQKGHWDWASTSNDVFAFRHWLDRNIASLKSSPAVHRAFGNHRKYQSLDAWKTNGTGAAVESYIAWVRNAGGHRELFARATDEAQGNPERAFQSIYRSMNVVSFGRTAKFDYLCMIGKAQLAPVEPDSVYFDGATGPVAGASLLFYNIEIPPVTIRQLQSDSDNLATAIGINKQAMEDSLCNWQKSPLKPVAFRG
jgi:hypothetical protein